jgi:hypothetical protein
MSCKPDKSTCLSKSEGLNMQIVNTEVAAKGVTVIIGENLIHAD